MQQGQAVFVSHPAFLKPGFGRHHPLSTARQSAVVELAMALGWLAPEAIDEAPLPDLATLARFHDAPYLAALERVSRDRLAQPEDRQRYNLGSMECPVFEGLWERARASVGGAIRAAEHALGGAIAFHPAGGTHHGRRAQASGFCYLNDPVFAVLTLLDAGLDRIVYVDLDAHHGDGVEAAFADDPRVHLISIHEQGRWPGTGATGTSADGRIVNVAVPPRIGDGGYQKVCDEVLAPALARWHPQAVVITLGADALAGDPLSTMGLSNRRLWAETERCIAAAPRAVVLGGGGYNPWTTSRLWTGLWGRLIGAKLPDRLPAQAIGVLEALDSDLIDAEERPRYWTTTIADPQDPPACAPDVRVQQPATADLHCTRDQA